MTSQIAAFVARINELRAMERALNPFTQTAERTEVQGKISRNTAKLEELCSINARRISRAAGYPCAEVA